MFGRPDGIYSSTNYDDKNDLLLDWTHQLYVRIPVREDRGIYVPDISTHDDYL